MAYLNSDASAASADGLTRSHPAHGGRGGPAGSDAEMTRGRSCVREDFGLLGFTSLQSIDKMGVGLLDAVDLMNPAQHQLGQGILV